MSNNIQQQTHIKHQTTANLIAAIADKFVGGSTYHKNGNIILQM